MEFAYNANPQQSAQTRCRVLDLIASERMPLIAYHFPRPGIGRIAKRGQGFEYYPAPMVMQELPG